MDKKIAIQAAQVRHMFATSNITQITSVILASILAYMLREVIDASIVIAWLALIVLVALLRTALAVAYRHSAVKDIGAAHFWLTRFRLGVLLSGMAWGSVSLLMFPAEHLSHQVFIVATLSGLSAGGLVSYSIDLPSGIMYVVTVLTPLIIRMSLENNGLDMAMSAALFLYLSFMIMSLRYMNRHVSENITLRLDAAEREDKVRESEQRYRLLLNHSPVGIIHYDTNFIITYCNDRFAEIFNNTAEHLIGFDMKNVKDQSTLPALRKPMEGGLGYYEGHYSATLSDADSWIAMTCAPFMDGEGKIAGGIAIVQDITERKQNEIALKESESRFRSMGDSAPVLVWVTDQDKTATWFNRTALEFMGLSLEQVLEKGWMDRIHPDDLQRTTENFVEYFDRRESFSIEFRLKRHDGKYRWILDSGSPRFDENGHFLGFIGSAVDIDDRVAAEENLQILSTAVEQSPISVIITDVDSNIEYVNPRCIDITGYSSAEAIGQNPRLYQSGLTSKETYRELWNKLTSGQVWHGELINKRKDGEIYWEEAHIAPVKNEAGVPVHYVATKVDITERKRNEEAIRQSEERFRFILGNSPIAVRIVDIETSQVVFANQRYAELINAATDDVIGTNPKQYYADPQYYDDAIKRVGKGERVNDKLTELLIPGERAVSKWVLASYLQLEYQSRQAVLGWFYDISDRKAMEEQVQHLAHYDPLTDLPNRTLFSDRLQQALATAKRDHIRMAVMFIDLDKFKPINDTLGHDVGDLLLRMVAQRIQVCLRESDTVARIGGDEFVVLLRRIEAEYDASGVAEKIRYSLNQPFKLDGHSLNISSSIGIAIYPEHGIGEKELIKNADTAMYYAKASGRDNIKTFHSNMPWISS